MLLFISKAGLLVFTLVIFRVLYFLLFGLSLCSVLKAVLLPIMIYFYKFWLGKKVVCIIDTHITSSFIINVIHTFIHRLYIVCIFVETTILLKRQKNRCYIEKRLFWKLIIHYTENMNHQNYWTIQNNTLTNEPTIL